MKKINYKIEDVYFEDNFSEYFYNNVIVYVRIGSVILPIKMKIGGLSSDCFDEDEEISEEEYQAMCVDYANDMIYEMINDELIAQVMDRLENFDIYSTIDKDWFENETNTDICVDEDYIECMKWINNELDLAA